VYSDGYGTGIKERNYWDISQQQEDMMNKLVLG
jgi:hypothetical protein